jgi:hypothetical protein
MKLTQLIYVSDLVDQNESELAAIVESAMRHNQKNGITGMMLYAEGSIIQVLEGEESAVLETYGRVCQDQRHRHVTRLLLAPVSERHFAQWSMGFKRLRTQDIQKFPQYAPFFRYGFGAKALDASPGDALDMLTLFSQRLF